MIHISLFSGIGGFEIAAEMVGWENAGSCEINDFGHKVLQYHFPNSYHHRDVKTLTYQILNEELTKRFGPNWRSGGVILSGGFPCQGFSVAGLRAGTDDDRYLWPEYLRLIDEINPDWVCGENVTGILTMEDKSGVYRDVFAKVENRKITRLYPVDYYEAIYTRQSKMLVNSICESLEERGYEVQPFAIPAASVEAPHKRERIWFVAHSESVRSNREKGNVCKKDGRPGAGQLPEFEQPGCGHVQKRTIADTDNKRRSTRLGKVQKENGEISERNNHAEPSNPNNGITSNTNEINGRGESQGRGETPGTRGQPTGGDTISVADSIGNRGGKGVGGKQSKLINKDGETKRINPDSRESGLQTTKQKEFTGKDRNDKGRTVEQLYASQNGNRGHFDNFPTQSPVCGGDDGIPNKLDGITFSSWRNESIKAFGNAVVPQVVCEIFKAIADYEASIK